MVTVPPSDAAIGDDIDGLETPDSSVLLSLLVCMLSESDILRSKPAMLCDGE